MSASDLAGAVAAIPASIALWITFLRFSIGPIRMRDHEGAIFTFVGGVAFTAWAAYCAARLCGMRP